MSKFRGGDKICGGLEMKIIFDLRRVGLGHNGGSLTLIKSGNTLHDMGHEVTFIDSGRNQNKWVHLEPF